VLNLQLHLALGENRSIAEFKSELEGWNLFGKKSIVQNYRETPVFINEFWTSKQRAAHSLHEISYRACFKPQLPNFFITRLTAPGDIVFDPFMGRGTTLLEAAMLGRNALGNDINPLSRILVEPRFDPPTISEIEDRLRQLPLNEPTELPVGFEVFFEERTLTQICNLRKYLLDRRASCQDDNIDRWVQMVAINRLTGHSKGFFSVYSLPPNQATSIKRQRRINEQRNQTPDFRDVVALIARKSRSLLKDMRDTAPSGKCVGFLQKNVEDEFDYEGPKVRLSVTSPPFMNIVNYKQDNWMRCWFAGIDTDSINITQTSKLETWKSLVKNALLRVAGITLPGGFFAFEVGEIKKGTLLLEQIVTDVACETPWEPVCIMINKQVFTKTSNTWGVSNNSGGTNSNRIVLLKLP